MIRLGILYPGYSGERDYAEAEQRLEGVEIRIDHTDVPDDVHVHDAAIRTGADEHLHPGAERLRDWQPDSVFFACTCASFVYGLEGAREQARKLQEAAGVPASSTSLAFVDALQALGVKRVAVAATYPAELTSDFVEMLGAAGVEVVAQRSLGIMSGGEVAESVTESDATEAVRASDHADAEAILMPDTALPSLAWVDAVEAEAGKLLLTANQVSLWSGLRLAGDRAPRDGFGRLLREA